MQKITDQLRLDPRPDSGGTGPTRQAAAWIGVVAICVAVVLGTSIRLLGNGPLPIDAWWHNLMLAVRFDVGLTIARTLHVIGGVNAVIVTGLAIVIGFLIARRPWSALTVTLAILASQSFIVLQTVFARPRPADSLSTVGFTSYPSGHTTLAATVVVVVALLLRRRGVWLVAAVWVLLMAWSRTYLAAHWLTDTVGGALVGIAVAMLVWSGVSNASVRIRRRRPAGQPALE